MLLRVTLCMCGVLFASSALVQDDVEKELKKLKGSWKFVSSVVNGIKIPPTAFKSTVIEIDDNKMAFRDAGKAFDEIEITIDLAKKPKEIDLEYTSGLKKGIKEKGIFELDGDNLTICVSLQKDKRPKTFASPPGGSQQLWKLKRAGS